MSDEKNVEAKPGETVRISTENLPHGGYINIALQIVSSPVKIVGTVLLGILALFFAIFIFPGNDRLQNILLARFESKPQQTAAPATVTPAPTASTSAPAATPQTSAPVPAAQSASTATPASPGAAAFALPQSIALGAVFKLSTKFKGPNMVTEWVEGGEPANRARLSERSNRPVQAWSIEAVGGDFHRIKSRAPDKNGCLDVDSRTGQIEIRACADSLSQFWRFGKEGSAFRLFNKSTSHDMCVDVHPTTMVLALRRCTNATGQAWQIDAVN